MGGGGGPRLHRRPPPAVAPRRIDRPRIPPSQRWRYRCSAPSKRGSGSAQARIHERAAELTALDQAIGDGDHGINIDRGFSAIVAVLDAGTPPVDGPEAGAGRGRSQGRRADADLDRRRRLRAALRHGVPQGRPRPSVRPDGETAAAVRGGLEAAAAGVSTLGKSTTGEKTMLDALVPAATAARRALESGADVQAVLAAARDAADAGVTATIPIIATKGRASYLGERSVGHADPGATSAALLIGALADAAAAA